ncbi:MAG: phosphopyruvate hydratase [Alphaproteobacteria bacterium GM202ARS2]|nr:phosphopyruvate hydratase [Alphaproteobacteria bacterium GM202ARS2]
MYQVITHLRAREILDSRGTPTIEVDVTLDNGVIGRAAVPSGASTGRYEAHEKRDGNVKRYFGKGVLKAIDAVHTTLADALEGHNVYEQQNIDTIMCQLDGTPEKKSLGANALLAVSLACLKAAATNSGVPLYRHIGGNTAHRLPVPLVNVMNGGAHANNALDIQEFMLVPWGADTFSEALRWSAECFHALKSLLQDKGFSTAVGDEGGFAPPLKDTTQALDMLCQAIEKTSRKVGTDIAFALDVAANELYHNKTYTIDQQTYTSDALIDWYQQLRKKYPIVSIEDGLQEDDLSGWQNAQRILGSHVQLVGDDLFVTNPQRLRQGIAEGWANALLVKINQIGTLTQTAEAIRLAQDAQMGRIMSHRSGETEDTSIADLAVGFNCPQIKIGSTARSERLAKYNQLLRIEEQLGASALYDGKKAFPHTTQPLAKPS